MRGQFFFAACCMAITLTMACAEDAATVNSGVGGTNPSLGGASTSSASGGSQQGSSTSAAQNGTGGSTASTSRTGGTTSNSGNSTNAVIDSSKRSGEATYYTSNNNGACGFTTTVSSKDFAALNAPDYGMADWCGACAEVTGPDGSVGVIISDKCPECKTGDLDLKPESFDKIATRSAGRVPITWHFVPCDTSGPVQYHYKDGSSASWTAVLVRNHRLPIAKLEFSTDGGSTWKATVRQDYNYFLASSGFGSGEVKVRLTASNGETIIDTLPAPTSNADVNGQGNF